MCNQAVSLVAAECERRGISTVAIALLREAAQKLQPPRALFAPFPHGYPLDRPDEPAAQRAVIEAALAMLQEPGLTAPALVDYQPVG